MRREGYLCSRQLGALTRLTDGGRFPMRSDPGTIWALHIPSWQTLRPFLRTKPVRITEPGNARKLNDL